MIEVRQSLAFGRWYAGLRDTTAQARIDISIRRLSLGNVGDAKPVGEGVSELRIDYGPGYRVYFPGRGALLIVLLGGGDKVSQDRDIAEAKALAREIKEAKS